MVWYEKELVASASAPAPMGSAPIVGAPSPAPRVLCLPSCCAFRSSKAEQGRGPLVKFVTRTRSRRRYPTLYPIDSSLDRLCSVRGGGGCEPAKGGGELRGEVLL